MFIKRMVVEGVNGDVEIRHTDYGALVTISDGITFEVRNDEGRRGRLQKAGEVAKDLVGLDPNGLPLATDSMILDVLGAIEGVAGCGSR